MKLYLQALMWDENKEVEDLKKEKEKTPNRKICVGVAEKEKLYWLEKSIIGRSKNVLEEEDIE